MERRAYLKEFVQQISELPDSAKMPQIGIEPAVLGLPRENLTFAKARSFFLDTPYDTVEAAKVPKAWLEFERLPVPLDIIPSMPDLTLFFMFYAQPRDPVQVAASEELRSRGWSFDPSDARWSFENEQGEIYEFDLHTWAVKRTK